MRSSLVLSALLACAMLFGCSQPEPVHAKKVPKTFTEFGHQRVDDYFWMNNPDDSTVIEHLKKENAYTNAMLKHTEPLQKRIYDELVGRIEQTYESLPVKENNYWHYIRYQEGQQYPIYCRKHDSLTSREEVYLNVPEMATGHQIFMVRGYAFSPDNRWLAYGIDTTGDRRSVLYIKNMADGHLSSEVLTNTSGDYQWAKDNSTLFYVLNDATVRAYRVMRHTLGTDPGKDRAVYSEPDSTFGVSLSATKDHAYIFLSSRSTLTSEWHYISAAKPDAAPVTIQPRQRDLLYSVMDHEGDALFIHTNKNAKNFKLVQTSLTSPGMAHWRDIIPHRPDALLEQAAVYTHYIIAQQRINGLNQILVIDRRTKQSRYVDFGEQAYVAELGAATDAYDLDSIRYSYSSLTTPRSDYYYGLVSAEKSLLKRAKVGGGYHASLYETQRIWAVSPDSVSVPISIVYRKNLFKHDASNPLLLYAYGSYGVSTDPNFNSSIISLLDRGFVFGIAHIRGGQEMGRQWYEDGKVLKKKNTFIDYVACAKYLVDNKYTSPQRLFANGGSAGGMLMGAVTNMRPDLFRGVLAEVPWMDVITDSENPGLPLTTLEYDEWGDPGTREAYEYLLTWSPYDNVKDAKYPAIFATGGLHDTQVPYFSPAKWVAKVREHNLGTNPVMFRVNMSAGHSGESGRFERMKLTAMKYAFMLDLLGIKE
jgi:oligopeptidase B